MGADMCLMVIAHPRGKKIDLAKGMRYIDHLTDSDVTNAKDDPSFEFFDFQALNEPDALDLEGYKDLLRTLATEVVESLNRRDVTTLRIFGWELYVTGGMTWGDDPTETFNLWNQLWQLGLLGEGLYEALGFVDVPMDAEHFVINELP